MKSLLLAALGFAVVLPLSCGTVIVLSKSKRADATKGWALVPIVVAAVDVPEGAELSMEMLSQRSIPEQFVTASEVRPEDAARIVGRRVNFPIVAGDPITWSQFAPLDFARLAEACRTAIHPAVAAAVTAAEAEALAKRSGAPAAGPAEPLPEVSPFPGELVKVVVAAEDVAEGTRLRRGQLTTADFPGYLVTASLVPAAELGALDDALLTVPVQQGDPISWVQLARPGGPETVAGCTFRLEAAVAEAKRTTAEREAKAWTPAGQEAP